MEAQQLSPRRPSVTLLTLPVELRLLIAEFVLEQDDTAGEPIPPSQRTDALALLPSQCAENLSLRLVCRQLTQELTRLAYKKTIFLLFGSLTSKYGSRMQELPVQTFDHIRKLTFASASRCRPSGDSFEAWEGYVFNEKRMHLDELVLFWSLGYTAHQSNQIWIPFFRRLKNVQTIKIILYHPWIDVGTLQPATAYRSLVGAFMKVDHFERYDAPGAPNIEATWWAWSYEHDRQIITLKAQEPRPALPEEDYMRLMKPQVDALMAEAERAVAEAWSLAHM